MMESLTLKARWKQIANRFSIKRKRWRRGNRGWGRVTHRQYAPTHKRITGAILLCGEYKACQFNMCIFYSIRATIQSCTGIDDDYQDLICKITWKFTRKSLACIIIKAPFKLKNIRICESINRCTKQQSTNIRIQTMFANGKNRL